MPWRGPQVDGEYPTLGFAALELITEYLTVPSGALAGQPLVLTDEQARFFLRWYALDPKTGKFVYRRGCIRRSKGWGKSPGIAAPWAFVEFVGDVVPAGWDGDGEPVGRPWPTPWLQVAAVSEDQTDNTYVALYEMLSSSRAVDDYRLDVGQTRIYKAGKPGSRIEPVTASSGSREGQPLTGAVLDQTETWTRSNHGVRLAATLRRNATKTGGRTLETPNAHSPGEDSVAEATFKAYETGTAGLLYDSREAPEVEDLNDRRALRAALKVAYGDSTKFVPIERLIADIQDPMTDPADGRRWFLNQIVKASGRAIDPRRWQELANRHGPPAPGARVGLGFDGSISDDATALMGCTAEGYGFVVRIWERPLGAQATWRVPRLEVHAAVAEAFEGWSVGLMLCDPAKWYSEIDQWQELFGDRVEALDTNSATRFAPACDRLMTAVREGSYSHDGDPVVDRHVANMARKPVRVNVDIEDGRTRYVFVKSGTGKIDAGVAATLALQAAETMPPDTTLLPHVAGPVDEDAYNAALAQIVEEEQRALESLESH